MITGLCAMTRRPPPPHPLPRNLARDGKPRTTPRPPPDASPNGLAEGGGRPGVTGGVVVGAPGRSEPAHAVRQPRGGEPHLCVAKAGADLPQHGTLGDPQTIETNDRVAAGHEPVEGV